MKITYIYRVDLGHHGKVEKQEFCYARNAKTAIKYYKDKYRELKYDLVTATAFGDADINKHPGPIEELPKDEVKYLVDNHIGYEKIYSNRVQKFNGMFVPISKET